MVSPLSGAAIRPAPALRTGGAASADRLYFLDHLRTALTFLVIAHHVGQAFGPTGGAWPIQTAARAALLSPFFTVNRSFFMSLFFMIAGYFMVMSCDAIGPRAFLSNRLRRLGIPLLIWSLLMVPVQLFLLPALGAGKPTVWPIEAGHLWFVQHLLIFSAVYALWRMWRGKRAAANAQTLAIPRDPLILAFALGLAVVSGVVRIWYPIDRWVHLLGYISVAWADVPRDLSFFVIGAVAYRQGWLLRFPTRSGYTWLAAGMFLAVAYSGYVLILEPLFPLGRTAWGAIYPIWESLLCCGMCIGLTVLFRERLNLQDRLGKVLARRQYGAYIWHVPVVLLLQGVVIRLAPDLPPLAMWAIVTAAAIPLTFWVVGLDRLSRRRELRAAASAS